ncbi:MAG TPA: DUF6458 family protein [Thermoleophilaceae bacterium]
MTIGASLFMIAVGAILKYAVTVDIDEIDLEVVGTILMLIGILGLVISLAYTFAMTDRRRGGGGPYDAPPPPRDRF